MDSQITSKNKNKKDTASKNSNSTLVRLLNRCSTSKEIDVVLYLLDHGPTTRSEVVKGTGIKWTTAHDTLTRLLLKNIVVRKIIRENRGRPTVYWSLAKNIRITF